MDIVNETPSIVNIQRFPQREDERKKTKKKYPQTSKPFEEHLKEARGEVCTEEDNVIDITPKKQSTPPMNTSWLYQSLLEDR